MEFNRLICREHCFQNGLVMRHVGDRMIISPPLIITEADIDRGRPEIVEELAGDGRLDGNETRLHIGLVGVDRSQL